MATTQLESSKWKNYFDHLAHVSRKKEVYVEATGLRLGNQVESEWLPLMGITYDPKNDLLNVATEKVDHMIRHPSAIRVHYESDGLHDLEVTDASGERQIIRLREPLKLTKG